MSNNHRVFLGIGLLAAVPWLLGAATDGSSVEDRRTVITVTGRAEAPQETAMVVVAAGVESDAPTASRAMSDNAAIIARLRRVLARMNIRPQDVRTANLSLSPQRDSHEGRQIVGFRATHRLTIVFRDVEQSGSVIDALVDVGANNIEGPRLGLWGRNDRPDPRARALAIADANNQAQSIARSLGLHVRRVLKMNDGGTHVSQNPQAMIARSPGTEIMPGEDVALTTVNAEYELVR